MLGLPPGVIACLFDLDGVLTQTARVHAAAWKQMFDEYLRSYAERTGDEFVPFDAVRDYDEYVDGEPRYDGVRSLLASRGIQLPEGDRDDPPGAETIHGLGSRKNEIVLRLIREQGVFGQPRLGGSNPPPFRNRLTLLARLPAYLGERRRELSLLCPAGAGRSSRARRPARLYTGHPIPGRGGRVAEGTRLLSEYGG